MFIPDIHLLFAGELGATKSISCSSQRTLNLVMKLGEGAPSQNSHASVIFIKIIL